ncbi:MAG TPA: phosphatidylserine/phosphatidylglycerophosphate/cardiolipin synthase family protein [Verrucomicrobiae bacterium]|nr:phosphatidylserine/phosphatidylglycerophosphate/cardiolipin synthase family protein [Verrucomicrobiae bacterium]
MLRIFPTLCLVLLLAGCAVPGPRSRYVQQIQPFTLTNLLAFRYGTNLELRIPMRGRDAFAHASWAAAEAITNYQHRIALLTFDRQKRAFRRSVTAKTNRVVIRSVQQWNQLTHEIFTGLLPRQPGHGVLLLVQNREVVIFRDKDSRFRLVKLEDKPPDITVDHTYNDTDFAREAIRLLERGLTSIDRSQTQFLFVTGEDPAFVLVDLQGRLIVFIDSPGDPETEEVPLRFAMRAFNTLVVRSLVVTAVKNPFTLVCRGLWHLGNSGAAMIESGSEISLQPPAPLNTGPGMDLAAWERQLDHIVRSRRRKGRVDLLIDGEKFFPAFIESVQGATRSVDVQTFIFDTDDYAVKIADLLKKKSAAVKVKVLMDDMGSLFATQAQDGTTLPPGFQPPPDIKRYLKAGSKVRVRASANPWLTVDHRKCMIIDDRQAYLGGMNIGRQYRYDWHDMMVGLTGPIVGRIEKDYRLAWAHAGPFGDFGYAWEWLFGRVAPRKHAVAGAIDMRLLHTSTFRLEIYRAQLAAIDNSKSYIYIENPYFDDDLILRALIRARMRGVDVRVIFPAKNDSGIMQLNNIVMANDLIGNGIRVYAYPGMTHLKAAIYDGWACLGSANLNKMSLRIGQELDIAYSDPASVDQLKKELFETDFRRSREVKKRETLNWLDSLVKVFSDQL